MLEGDPQPLVQTTDLPDDGLAHFLETPPMLHAGTPAETPATLHMTPWLDASSTDEYEPSWFVKQIPERLPVRARVLLRLGINSSEPQGVAALYFPAVAKSHAVLPGEVDVLQGLREIASEALALAVRPSTESDASHLTTEPVLLRRSRLSRQREKLAVAFGLGIRDKSAIEFVTGPHSISAKTVNKVVADACVALEKKGVALIEMAGPGYRREQLRTYWLENERHLPSSQKLAREISAAYDEYCTQHPLLVENGTLAALQPLPSRGPARGPATRPRPTLTEVAT
jgi:hypothetical protein